MHRKYVFLLIWVAVICMAAFGFDFACKQEAGHPGECSEFVILMLSILTFPSGWAVLKVGGELLIGAFSHWGVEFDEYFAPYVMLVIGMVVVGYYQWFVLVPYLVRKVRGLMAQRRAREG